jgi:outer membrane protein assembly factor BamB
MQNKRFQLFLAVIVVALCILGLAGCNPYWVPLPTPAVHHTPLKTSGLSGIWSLPNIYAEQAYYMPKMVANAGRVTLFGSMSNDEEDRLICLDGSSGKVAWERGDPDHKERGYLSAISATPSNLYVGYGGVPSVKKLDLSTGDVLWSQPLPGRGLLYIFVIGDEVQIVTTLEWFTRLNADNGKVIEKVNGRGILFSTSQITISPTLMNELQAEDTTTGKLIWRISLDRELRMAPLFTEDAIYLRSGETMGSVYAVQRSTGKVLWKTDDIVISNIAVSPAKKLAYVLTREGKLLGIDIDTGMSTTLIEFSNGPFTLNGEDIVGGYELAYDQTTRSLFILLGDSRQLFAFKEEE